MTGVGRAALITAGAAVATIAVDRALKVGVEHSLQEGEASRPLGIPVRRRTNDHALAGGAIALAVGGVLALGIGVGATALRRPTLLQVGAGMVAGGIAANIYDRATTGRVTDFLPSPLGVMNAADAGIGAGVLLAGVGLALR
ncbi:MAG: hypothetical protein JWM98_2913 [Thermoleophilia bacterium]|nr:hypothetical protein [Thermoleophilia bacterium]